MMRTILTKTLYEKRGFIIGWTLGLAAFGSLMTVFFPAMRPEGALDGLMASMPPAFEGFIGEMSALRSFDTYLATQLFDIRGSIIIGIMAVVLGVGLSAKAEETGELRTLLAQPISRTRLFVENWLAMVLIIIVTVFVGLAGGIYLAAPFIEDATLPLDGMMRTLAMTVLLMTAFATVAYAAGMETGKRSMATLIGTVVLALCFIVTTFATGVDWLRDIEHWSLLHYFQASEVMTDGVAWSDVAVLIVATIVLLVLSLIIFRRRDIA